MAREFQLDEIAPIVSDGFSPAAQTASTQALLENLDELLGRLRQVNAAAVSRKETMSRIHEALKKAEQERSRTVTETGESPARARDDSRAGFEGQFTELRQTSVLACSRSFEYRNSSSICASMICGRVVHTRSGIRIPI